jgi:flagellar motor switch protein FliM
MPDILDQSEVDALLEAVKKGSVVTGAAAPAAVRSDSPHVQHYDFKRPERVSKEQLRALQNVNEIFARNLGATIASMIRTIVEVRLLAVEQMNYGEFIASLPNPTCFNLLEVKALDGEAILEISPSTIFPIIDRLLGGGLPETSMPNRPLTQIEQRLASSIIQRAVEQLRAAWANIAELDFVVTKTEYNPQLMQIRSPNEAVVVARFEAKIGKANGLMNLCFPFVVIEPVISGFTAQTWLAQAKKHEARDYSEQIGKNLSKATLEAVCYLAESTIRLSDLVDLQVGHIIETDRPANSDISLCIEGKLKFKCKAGVHKNHKAILLTRETESGEGI